MRADGVDETLGNYDDYLEKKRRAGFEEADASSGATRTELEKQKRRERLRRESRKALERRVADLEAEIERTEAEIQRLEEKMGDP
jgi:ATP-binding cassette subfamily F protein 3